MKIKYHVKTIVSAPPDAVGNIFIAFIDRVAILSLDDHVVHRNSYVVKACLFDLLDIRLSNEGIEMLLAVVVVLGEPSTQVCAKHKSIKFLHFFLQMISSRKTSLPIIV